MYWTHHYWGMHLFWWIFWFILVVSLVVLAVWPFGPRRRLTPPPDPALDELRRFYATGQITEEEYRHRLAVLSERAA